MKSSNQVPKALEELYTRRYNEVLVRIAEALDKQISQYMQGQERIDRISVRAKSVDRFLEKAAVVEQGTPKYSEPLSQIQDQLGARIVVFYNQDIGRVEGIVKRYYTAIEYKDLVPESESEFGYFGHHLVLVLPSDVVDENMDRSLVPRFFELQIKTLFQHAWSEAHHDLGYKPSGDPLSSDQKRRVAFTSAQAWGADLMFEQLFQELGM